MTALVTEPYVTAGEGWAAQIDQGQIELHVNPYGAWLGEAVNALLTPKLRRFYVLDWLRADEQGWDVYLITREAGLQSV